MKPYKFYNDKELQRFLDLYPLHMDIGNLVEETREYAKLVSNIEEETKKLREVIDRQHILLEQYESMIQ